MKSYGEYCVVAQALDVIGDRWTLLIARELLIRGPCRYSDLLFGLPGIASNLLVERLRDMESSGVIQREDAPPPIATTIYTLTPRGEGLKPVIEALARWGRPLIERPIGDDVYRSHWLKFPLELFVEDANPRGSPISIEVHSGEQAMQVTTADGAIMVKAGKADRPNAVISGTASLVLGTLTKSLDLAEARRRGLQFEGDVTVLERLRPRQSTH